MIRDGEVWTLHHGDHTIGRIAIDDGDFPWLEGNFEPLPGFEEFKPLFDRSLELVHDDPKEWEAVYTQIESRLELHSADGPAAAFLLHIESDRAWFRWTDTPFD
jgi:hypothetical protein